MYKLLLVFLILSSVSTGWSKSLKCKSKNYKIISSNLEAQTDVNYGIDGWMNDGAEVEIIQKLISKNIVALSINVDGAPAFELSVIKKAKNTFAGQLFYKDKPQPVNCLILGNN